MNRGARRQRAIVRPRSRKRKKPYQTWKRPFSGVDRKRDLAVKLNISKGIGLFFGMRF